MLHRILLQWTKTVSTGYNVNFSSLFQRQHQQQQQQQQKIFVATATIGIGCYYLFYKNDIVDCADMYVPTNTSTDINDSNCNSNSISSLFPQQQQQQLRWIEVLLQKRLLYNNYNTMLGYRDNYYNNIINHTSCSSSWIPSSVSSSSIKQLQVMNDNTVGRNNDDEENTTGSNTISLYSPHLPIHIIRPNNNLEIAFDKRTRNAIYVQHRIVLSNSTGNINYNSDTSKSPKCTGSSSVVDNNDDEYDNNENDNLEDEEEGDDNNSTSTSTSTSTRRHVGVVVKTKRQRYNFKEDISISEQYRSRNSYYHLSGYDRGHLAPAGDFVFTMNEHNNNNYNNNNNYYNNNDLIKEKDQQQQQFLKEIEDTYNLCNISPQNSIMNRTIWSYLEYLIRKVTRTVYNEYTASTTKNDNNNNNNNNITVTTYITTGPLWIPSQQISNKLFVYQYNAIGIVPSLIHVPTHFYKAFIIVVSSSSSSDNNTNNTSNDTKSNKIIRYGCFVIPNDDSCRSSSSTEQNSNSNGSSSSKATIKNQVSSSSIADYIVTWYDLETITGLTFYSNIITNEWKQNADNVTQSIIQATRKRKNQRVQQPLLLLLPANQSSSSSKLNTVSSSSSSSSTTTIMSKWDSNITTHFCDNNVCERSPLKEKNQKVIPKQN